MSYKNKIIWSEGLFLKPQHFQQHDRYLEHYVEARSRALRNHSWGFEELALDVEQLAVGKIAISQARGVLPDGTPFDIPDQDRTPAPMDIDESVRDRRIYLALPVRREGEVEFSSSEEEGLARFVVREISARDVSDYGQDIAEMRVGSLRTRLLSSTDQRQDYVCLGIAHVLEAKADRSVTIDRKYVPPILNVQTAPFLARFVSELQGLLHQRGEALAGRVTASQGGDFANILILQSVNRYEPVVAHLAQLNNLHPEEFFRLLLEMAGDLSTTLSGGARRPPEFPQYNHDELSSCFLPVMDVLRELFGKVVELPFVEIALEKGRVGFHRGLIEDRSLLGHADFVLAVRADITSEELRVDLPPQIKVSSVEGLKDLFEAGISGIPISPLPVKPPELPTLANCVYFQLERSSEHWPSLTNSGGFGIYVGGEFPGLNMQLFAILRK